MFLILNMGFERDLPYGWFIYFPSMIILKGRLVKCKLRSAFIIIIPWNTTAF